VIGIFAEGSLAQLGFNRPMYANRPVMLAMQVTPDYLDDSHTNSDSAFGTQFDKSS